MDDPKDERLLDAIYNGYGAYEDFDDDDEEIGIFDQCQHCCGAGEVPTRDYESYFGAQYKPCPMCWGTPYGSGHGRLS